MKDSIALAFKNRFGNTPELFRSPGRVNLIGEHTDYNEGFVLPASVDKAIHFAIRPNGTGTHRLYANDLKETFQIGAGQIAPGKVLWANYLLGVVAQFQKAGRDIPGFDCAFGGDVPLGAGMSSSAAIEDGLAFALNELYQCGFSRLDLVKMAQKAEHEYAGVQCGIMDQFAIMHGKKDQVIKLDCRSLEFEYFPLTMEHHLLVLVNTGVKHSLASSEYNIRRQECEKAVSLLSEHTGGLHSLRDVPLDLLTEHRDQFPGKVYQRASYVIEENQRLLNACAALNAGNLEEFGQGMYGSHEGLRDKYEVSCPELDHLVETARTIPGVLGARMMGGGFGGCTINLLAKDRVGLFEQTIRKHYKTPDGKAPEIYEVIIEDGTQHIR